MRISPYHDSKASMFRFKTTTIWLSFNDIHLGCFQFDMERKYFYALIISTPRLFFGAVERATEC